MKASRALKLAQIAVMEFQSFAGEDKLEILKVLMEKEELALYMEEVEAKNK